MPINAKALWEKIKADEGKLDGNFEGVTENYKIIHRDFWWRFVGDKN
jgi:hypothetical protein